jgi:hypothetical protein
LERCRFRGQGLPRPKTVRRHLAETFPARSRF